MKPTRMDKISKVIVKYRNWILLIATLLLIPSAIGYFNTRINYDILSYLPADKISMKAQDLLNDDFNLGGTAMVVLNDTPDQEVQALKEQIDAIPGVDKTLWRTDLADLDVPTEALPSLLRDALYQDGSTMIIVTFTNPSGSDETMDAVNAIEALCDDNAHIAGFSAITADTRTVVNQETPIYTIVAVLLCLIVLSLGLKSWLAPFIFLLGMIYPIVYNAGSNIIFGEISYLTNALSMILLLAVSMDYSIFLLHRYQEEKSKTKTKEEAMAKAIHATWVSITSSSITTIAGFMALVVMQLTLGRDIGLVMAKGVLLAVMSTILILPSLLMFFDPWIEKWQHPVLIRPLRKTAVFVSNHYKAFCLALALLIVPAWFAQNNVNQYYDLTASLPADLSSTIGTNDLKEKFDMNTSHFLMVNKDIPAAKKEQMLKELENTDGVTSVLSYHSIVGPAIPLDMEPEAVRDVLQAGNRELILVNTDYRAATDDMTKQLSNLYEIVHRYDENGLIAGEGALDEDLIQTTKIDFQMVNTVSIALIFIIIAITFKSLILPVILVLCIELAIFVNMGIPYFTGSTLPFIAGVVIGTIQLGACIDYAILMTTRYKEELEQGLKPKDAIRMAITMTSPSIITSGLSFFAACSGVSLVAKMDMIKSLCILLGRGALISVVVILTILPSMLLMFNGLISKTTKGWPKSNLDQSRDKENKEANREENKNETDSVSGVEQAKITTIKYEPVHRQNENNSFSSEMISGFMKHFDKKEYSDAGKTAQGDLIYE
ncbi:efflux RND transporter permease subunit [Ileibacterium valens]|uniref:efflux RND transporter permease subunit n=1 Tax=Ileibacterium valens TaxID=1862668 RepID=UPI002729612B|nr:MMPL family transporter [Ileibacterium valens]